MKKFRVIQFTIANTQGGHTQYILNNWKFINKEIFHFDFVTMDKISVLKEGLERQGCKVYQISCYAEENEKQFIKEVKEILMKGYDAIHIHTKYWKSFLVEKIAKECGIPKIIVHSHNSSMDNDYDGAGDELKMHYALREMLCVDIATDFWACSQVAVDWLYGEKVPHDMIRILPNAINISKYSYNKVTRDKMRERLVGRQKNKYILGNCGRFVYQKNHKFLIEIFAEIHQHIPDTVLMLLGEGKLKKTIEKRAKELGIADAVKFEGLVDNVSEYMQAFDLFLLPSHFEGLPIALVEAQAAGLKCLVSENVSREANVSGCVDFLKLSKELWCEKILESYLNIGERYDNNRIMIEQGFDLSKQIKELEHLYLS